MNTEQNKIVNALLIIIFTIMTVGVNSVVWTSDHDLITKIIGFLIMEFSAIAFVFFCFAQKEYALHPERFN